MSDKSYDNNAISVIAGAFPISGFSTDSRVKINMNADQFTLQVGVDGTATRSKSNNYSATIEVSLMQSSPSNEVFSNFQLADRNGNAGTFPLTIKDNNGATLYFAETCWVKKIPDSEYSAEASARVWMLETGNLISYIAGN